MIGLIYLRELEERRDTVLKSMSPASCWSTAASIRTRPRTSGMRPLRCSRGVEDSVNVVGVEVNTASVPLLARVAGLSETLARNLVSYREQQGAFANHQQLRKVPRLGPRVFEQAAGFLRIAHGDNPLDASAVR